ncbi:23S rRNA (cytidine1920-2'-O)/16S rRNA (cytidine1409-2'-O)-methyltransferase [Geoalkalibacter ferrihydriticus]|uniref:Hemolysin n=2 Tax=Geoalkalibacter ferrihydriticus TaxID=392333 RepID=A0A0C2HID6_9BACT|nr:TlyA family RNA methyltransferase [Geoalkalibacter ferrihydriticus]KIH76781.1 hemolysin [Geoalkalibacter ferrihydriticus DSM 17813]SDL51707.1 23S rRNA (cytidine1920-2'-O)/16S rRNA (cytidine1409-2'-O)-methyltransferase [Geoalkalibacter ferrihydriticus]
MEKQRLDKLLMERGLAASRQRAQALILAGQVLVDGMPMDKAGTLVKVAAEVRLRGEDMPYVSRGGLKLAAGLDAFALDVRDLVAIDVGASTGGFTDCLLQRGAARVYAVDVGYGQLAWKLRQDERVINMERTNIRDLAPEKVPEELRLAVIDASFISLEKVLPPTLALLAEGSDIVALIKPQFEVGRGQVGKGGVVRDAGQHAAVVEKISQHAQSLGCQVLGVTDSPLLGPKGNREFLIHLRLERRVVPGEAQNPASLAS